MCFFLALVRHPVNFLDAAHNEMVRERQVCTFNKDFCHPLKTTTDRNIPPTYQSEYTLLYAWILQ